MKISKRVAIPCLFLFFAFLFGCSQRNSQEISLPSSPTPLHGALLQSNNIELSWNPAEHSEGLQLLYSIFLSFEGGEFLQVASDLPFPSFSLSHLKPGTYTWKVTARTGALGVSSPEWLFSIDAETIPQLADPDDGVTEPELLVSDVQNNSISLQWPRFLVPSDPDQVITYVVSLFPSDQSAMLPRAQIHTEATGTVFSGLFTGETYTFEIVAQAQNGNTGTLGQGTVTPGNHRPSRPELLFPQDKEQGLPGSFLLSWRHLRTPTAMQFDTRCMPETIRNKCPGSLPKEGSQEPPFPYHLMMVKWFTGKSLQRMEKEARLPVKNGGFLLLAPFLYRAILSR